MDFEWDPKKAATNAKKHGVEFGEALTVFADPFELTIPDPLHSDEEARFLSLGRSLAGQVLIVSYTDRAGKIRIISARRATRKERSQYEG